MIARQMRTEAIIDGANIAIDTVLSSEVAAIELGKQLTTAGYNVQIIDIEVPYEISEKRIAKRWQHSYEQALANENSHGGRWVPSEYTRTIFDGLHGMSQPEANAQKLAHQCPAVSRYRVHRTTVDATETTPAVSSWEKDLVRSEYGAALTQHTTFTELRDRTEEFEEPVP